MLLRGPYWKGLATCRAPGRSHTPTGASFGNFEEFLQKRPKDQPYVFWIGNYEAHEAHRGFSSKLRREMGTDPFEIAGQGVGHRQSDVLVGGKVRAPHFRSR